MYDYLADIDKQAEKMFEQTIKSLAKRENITEELKLNSPMEWVRRIITSVTEQAKL